MSPLRFARSAAGQTEITDRKLNLPRHVRNLLLIINAAETSDHWVAQVKGCTEEDLFRLVADGLIEPADGPAPRTAAQDSETEYRALQAQLQQMPYAPLYELLNKFGKESLGLMGGYRFSLEVERCSGPLELQALALRFMERLRTEQGFAAVRRFGKALSGLL